MLNLRKSVIAAAAALAALPASAMADGRIHGSPFMSQPHTPRLGPYLFANHHNRQLPAFQAAPWYLYWPYDGHFQTPAPVHAPFYGPPAGGNFPVNPYFPGPAGYYGPMPGGPAPVMAPAPAIHPNIVPPSTGAVPTAPISIPTPVAP
ncbi:hypothetical protein [Urbifossiella limnaea]|uniref:Uncharacterized protein n=1 Tax=Urbifossiella limnaea TaxID=2528023 RepID=A0A517XVU5_9BACT|nr:hypothetical protein [Urbifossiella limnaea]QDU21631.1 hypothetical protein ETAA1_36020 [Urbifossiella limnaea]